MGLFLDSEIGGMLVPPKAAALLTPQHSCQAASAQITRGHVQKVAQATASQQAAVALPTVGAHPAQF
jgi:enhancing lycopene biosynthesis protein 2